MSSSARSLLEEYPVVASFPIAWGDMDAFQHVNNTRYFRYFENARIRYFEQAGISGAAGIPSGVGPILASTSCRFKAPLSYPDRVGVGARVVDIEDDRFMVEHAIASEQKERIVATGQALIVAFDYDTQQKTTVPDAWLRAIERVEQRDAQG